ncbi:MAG: outer membrane protein assembly factor BamD [bacterium]
MVILCFPAFWGCTKQERVLSDLELYSRGMTAFDKKRYQEAREYFQEIEALYPDSQHLALARVGTANTYYEECAYAEAIAEYQKLIEFYPLGKLSEWSQFRIGISHFRQILEEDRDQEEARKACSALEKFFSQYPKSQLIGEAQEKYQICRERMAGNELYTAKFYFKNKAYGAAIKRLQDILNNNPVFSRRDEVLYYLAKSYGKEGNKELEGEVIEILRNQYHDSQYTQRLLKEKSDTRN